MSEFSPTAILKAFNNGPFKSEAFVKSLNKRIFEVVRQQNIGTRDVIDVQPMIRKVIFGIIYGKPPEKRGRFVSWKRYNLLLINSEFLHNLEMITKNASIQKKIANIFLLTLLNWNFKLQQTALNQITISIIVFSRLLAEVAMGSEPTNCEEIFAASEK